MIAEFEVASLQLSAVLIDFHTALIYAYSQDILNKQNK